MSTCMWRRYVVSLAVFQQLTLEINKHMEGIFTVAQFKSPLRSLSESLDVDCGNLDPRVGDATLQPSNSSTHTIP